MISAATQSSAVATWHAPIGIQNAHIEIPAS